MRKAGVDVLVKLYERVGELLWMYIDNLGEAKVNNSCPYVVCCRISQQHLAVTVISQ